MLQNLQQSTAPETNSEEDSDETIDESEDECEHELPFKVMGVVHDPTREQHLNLACPTANQCRFRRCAGKTPPRTIQYI